MESTILISLCVVILLTCIMSFIWGHRLGAAQMERLNKQHAEMLAATIYLLAHGVKFLPDEDAPTDEKPAPKTPNLLLFKRGEEKSETVTPQDKE